MYYLCHGYRSNKCLLTLLTFGVVQNSYVQFKKLPPTLGSSGNRSPKKDLRGGGGGGVNREAHSFGCFGLNLVSW